LANQVDSMFVIRWAHELVLQVARFHTAW